MKQTPTARTKGPTRAKAEGSTQRPSAKLAGALAAVGCLSTHLLQPHGL